jgi:hypothetical protein
MKAFITAFLLVGVLGVMEGHAYAASCPETDNVKVVHVGGYGITVKYQNCQGEWKISNKIDGGQVSKILLLKAAEGSLVSINYADVGGDPKSFCTREVPVGKELQITTSGGALKPYCD